MRFRFKPYYLLLIPALLLAAFLVYNLPFVHDRLSWRVDELRTRLFYAINPPEEAVFVPQGQADPSVQPPLNTATPVPSSTPQATRLPTSTELGPTRTPTEVPTSTPTHTPIPESVRLEGFVHEYQKWNNCGPATLAMALSYWGWEGDQLDVAEVVKPNSRDKNVMPHEMETFVEEVTGLQAVVRVGTSHRNAGTCRL